MTGAYPVLHLGPVRSTRPWARTYRGTPASVPEARRFVGELLAGCPARETLMTCVSEFCANAITHTASGRGGVFTVEVDCPRDGIARVAVTDDGGASVPAAGRLDLMAEGGRAGGGHPGPFGKLLVTTLVSHLLPLPWRTSRRDTMGIEHH